MGYEISVAVLAIAFAVLVVAIIILIIALRRTLFQVNKTLAETRKQLEEIGGDAAKTMEHANQISYDVKRKIEALDPFFNAFSNIGEFVERKTFSLRGRSPGSAHEEKKQMYEDSFEASEEASNESVKASDVLDFVDVGLRLWQKIKKRSRR